MTSRTPSLSKLARIPLSLQAFAMSLLWLAQTPAFADASGLCKDCRPPKEVCFNVFCSYQREDGDKRGDGFDRCEAGAVFNKLVDADGREIRDESSHPDNPVFQVQCDDRTIFNDAAHRFTDHLGTRIQALSGPYPSVLLPKGALREGHRYEPSSLELPGQHLRGYCYVYTGPQ